MGQNEKGSEPEEVRKAYGEWKEGASLRELEAKYGVSKSKLSRLFQKIRKAEEEEARVKIALAATDEEFERTKREAVAAKNEEDLAKAKYQAKLDRDQHRREALRYQQMLEEYEALSDPEKTLAYAEKVLAKHPAQLIELEKRLRSYGLTLKDALKYEMDITPEDFQDCKELYLKYTGKQYSETLSQHILGRIDSWLKFERLEERKAQVSIWMKTHPPDHKCPKCGGRLKYIESGDLSCSNWLSCGWQGYYKCPNCRSRMRYDPEEKGLLCTNIDCWLTWK